MNKRTLNFWIIAVVGTVAFVWMIAELVRVVFEVGNQSGLAAVPLDGVVQHKVGELMVGVPFVSILALTNLWSAAKIRLLIRRSVIVMVVGGLLNALAWYSLRDRVAASDFLRIWCLIIFAFGLSAPWLLYWIVNRTSKTVSAG